MTIELQRTKEQNNSVFGELFIDGSFFCYTLEDKIRDVKIKHETCIPEGTYNVVMNLSQRFKTILPLLLNVPGFEGIRIHAGNTIEDTSGCILLGSAISGDTLLHSKAALAKFLPRLKAALRAGSVTIVIKNPVKAVAPTEKPSPIVEDIPVIMETPNDTPAVITATNTTLFTTILNIIKWLTKFFSKKS